MECGLLTLKLGFSHLRDQKVAVYNPSIHFKCVKIPVRVHVSRKQRKCISARRNLNMNDCSWHSLYKPAVDCISSCRLLSVSVYEQGAADRIAAVDLIFQVKRLSWVNFGDVILNTEVVLWGRAELPPGAHHFALWQTPRSHLSAGCL